MLIPAEKKSMKEAIKNRKESNNKKVSEALMKVWKLAKNLYHGIETNMPQYWNEYLIQCAGKAKTTCCPSTWNAFVSMRG
jgi:hypothetical protein